MATINNTIKTRIQLKTDIEANWINSVNFIPRKGEVIIYIAETAGDRLPTGRTQPYSFSRIKIGDGNNTVNNLPFIDASTIDGKDIEIVKVNTFNDLPLTGSKDKLYIVLSTNTIYHYNNSYIKISNFDYSTITTNVNSISHWTSGRAPIIRIEDNILKIINGTAPNLNYRAIEVVTGIEKEAVE